MALFNRKSSGYTGRQFVLIVDKKALFLMMMIPLISSSSTLTWASSGSPSLSLPLRRSFLAFGTSTHPSSFALSSKSMNSQNRPHHRQVLPLIPSWKPAISTFHSYRHYDSPTLMMATKKRPSTTEASKQMKKEVRPPKNTNKIKSNSNTGGLRKLPVVKSSIEIIDKAKKTAKQVPPDRSIKNSRNRARKHGAQTMDAITKSLCIPLRDVVNGYKSELRKLHPFEKVVADLTTQARQKKDGLTLLHVLEDINEARKELLLSGKDWTAKAKNAPTAREAMEFMVEGEERMYELFAELASKPLSLIVSLQKSLRTTPAVRLDTPAVVLVGAPNVGKSSIVRAISSATPEVNNYPFTTRGMTLGHVEVFWEDDSTAAASIVPVTTNIAKYSKDRAMGRLYSEDQVDQMGGGYAFSQLCQVMDSPGLLVRPDNERNEMEALTLAAMQHLPTAVMYVMDFSGGAGDKCSSVQDQLQLRREVRARFPRRPWIDVVSKYDLGVVDGSLDELEQILKEEEERGGTPCPYLKLSIKEGDGVEELRDEVMRMLGEVRVVLDAMAAVDARSARPSA